MATFSFFAVLLLCTVGAYCQDCSGPPPMQTLNKCCNIILPPPQEECVEHLREQRMAFSQSTNTESYPQTSDMCVSNCFFNDTNVITSDNKVNLDEIKLVLHKVFGTEWQALLPSIIDTCKERIDNSYSHGANEFDKRLDSLTANCDIGKEKLFFCIGEEFLIHCPDSAWNDSAVCNDMRSYLKHCPYEKRTLYRQP